MKNSIIKFFPFLPFDYIAMEEYISRMLENGYRLKWIRGSLAGFEKTNAKNIRYVADPYAATSPLNLRRLSKTRLDSYTENGWYFTGKARGCYIFQTDSPNADRPNLEDGLKSKIIGAQLNFVTITLALIILAFWRGFSSPAIVYTLLLTNSYIALAAGLLFLATYNIFYVFLLAGQKSRIGLASEDFSVQGAIRRGSVNVFRNFVFLLLAVSAFFLELAKTPNAIIYVFIPLAVIVSGTIAIKLVSKKAGGPLGKYLMPIMAVIAAAFLLILPTAINGLKSLSATPPARYENSSLPLLHISDVTSSSIETSSVKENISILGENILYSETSSNGIRVFTNYSNMKTKTFAGYIFNYLYNQAPVDYNEDFKPVFIGGYEAYILEKSNICLIQTGKTVFLFNITGMPDDTDLKSIIYSSVLSNPAKAGETSL